MQKSNRFLKTTFFEKIKNQKRPKNKNWVKN
jgi:hypothetical protein